MVSVKNKCSLVNWKVKLIIKNYMNKCTFIHNDTFNDNILQDIFLCYYSYNRIIFFFIIQPFNPFGY